MARPNTAGRCSNSETTARSGSTPRLRRCGRVFSPCCSRPLVKRLVCLRAFSALFRPTQNIRWIAVRPPDLAGRFWAAVFFFQAEDGIRDLTVTGVQTRALPIFAAEASPEEAVESARAQMEALGFEWDERFASPVLNKFSTARTVATKATAASVHKRINELKQIGRASCRERV